MNNAADVKESLVKGGGVGPLLDPYKDKREDMDVSLGMSAAQKGPTLWNNSKMAQYF